MKRLGCRWVWGVGGGGGVGGEGGEGVLGTKQPEQLNEMIRPYAGAAVLEISKVNSAK